VLLATKVFLSSLSLSCKYSLKRYLWGLITLKHSTFATMASQRLEKISALFKRDLNTIFQQQARSLCMGAMVSTTVVRVAPDLSTAKVYVSIFGVEDKQAVLNSLKQNSKSVRHELAQLVKNQMRKTPELTFFIDDSLDYAQTIDKLLKK
jgi:ribosome-binding factor A